MLGQREMLACRGAWAVYVVFVRDIARGEGSLHAGLGLVHVSFLDVLARSVATPCAEGSVH
jgi:hypothetical protein